MVPPPQLTSTTPGRIGRNAAIAKSFRLDRAPPLPATNCWVPLQTNTLTTTNWLYSDSPAVRIAAWKQFASGLSLTHSMRVKVWKRSDH